MSNFEKLKLLNLKESKAEIVRDLLDNMPILCIPFYINRGAYILRARKGGGFSKRSEMTYCPITKCSNLQRATLVGQTMFYGVISDDQFHQEDARCIAATECSKLCREGINSIGRETFTVSQWEVVKPLYVVSLITDQTFPNIHTNSLLNQLRDAYVFFHGNKKSTAEEKAIAQFISDEFSKVVNPDESYNYLISATVATDIVKDMRFDGIVFPSVQLGGQGGLNIALTTKATNKKLRFIRTLDQTIYKKGGKSYLRLEKVYEKGVTKIIRQIPNEYIIRDLNIKSLNELPIV